VIDDADPIHSAAIAEAVRLEPAHHSHMDDEHDADDNLDVLLRHSDSQSATHRNRRTLRRLCERAEQQSAKRRSRL